MFKDSLFKKIEDKTSVNKSTIMKLAENLQKGNMKDEKTLNELVDNLSKLTNTEVTEEKRKKIINAIINDKVPNNIETMM